jgi:hypothetical protein
MVVGVKAQAGTQKKRAGWLMRRAARQLRGIQRRALWSGSRQRDGNRLTLETKTIYCPLLARLRRPSRLALRMTNKVMLRRPIESAQEATLKVMRDVHPHAYSGHQI